MSYNKVTDGHSITIADVTKIHAHGMGDIKVTTQNREITLRDVWHVPNIGTSLLSVARIVDAGYNVEFGKDLCFVSKSGVRAKLGYQHGSLYHVRADSPAQNHEVKNQYSEEANLGLATNESPSASLETWHRKLCHRTLDDAAVRYISAKVRDMLVISTKGKEPTGKICQICALGRQHKEAETKTRERASEFLHTVHTDICGPMQTPTLHGERYFITFTDESSGRVSVCLLSSKDIALTAFHAYRMRAERASGNEIKSLHSDGGGKYINSSFKKYLEAASIQHIVSPAYSPSQKGWAERMSRTLMEGVRCMLEDSQHGKEF